MAIDPLAKLREDLAALDESFAAQVPGLDNAISAAAAAQATAGQEFQQAESGAAQEAQTARGEYQQYLDDLQGKITEAQGEIDSADDPQSSAAEIAAIEDLEEVTVASNDLGDIQAALDQLVSDVNTRLGQIRAAMTAIDEQVTNGAVGAALQGARKATEALQLQRDFAPPVIDTDALVDGEWATIEGLA